MQNIDELLLNRPTLAGPAQEEMARRGLRRGGQEREEKNRFIRTAQTMGAVMAGRSRKEALKEGYLLGREIRSEIRQKKFEGGTFYTVLLLSLIKDFADLATLGLGGVFLNIFLIVILNIIFLTQLPWIKRKIFLKYIVAYIIEFIPFINVFPSYTISAIWLKIKIDGENRALINQLKAMNKDYKLKEEAV